MGKKLLSSFFGAITLVLVLNTVIFAADLPLKLNLEDSIKYAMEHYPGVFEAQKKKEENDLKIDEAKSALFPKISLSSSYERFEKDLSYDTDKSFTADLSLSYPIYSGGKLSAAIEMAQNESAYQELELKKSLSEIRYSIANAYYSVLRAKKLLEIAEGMVEQSERHLKLAKANYDAGMVTKTDVLRMQVQLANDQQEVVKKKNKLELAQAAFKKNIGIDQSTNIELPEVLDYTSPKFDLDKCLSSALNQRSELQQLELSISSAEKQREIAQADARPSVTLEGNYKCQNEEVKFDNAHWRIGVQANMMLFDGGAVKAKVAQADKNRDALKFKKQELEQRVIYEVKEAYLELQEIEKRGEYISLNIEQASENLKITETRYAAGTGTSSEVIDALILLDEAKIKQADTVFEANNAVVKLKKAMGEN